MSEWKPIETAPVGKAVLIWDGKHHSIAEQSDWRPGDWLGLIEGDSPWCGDSSTGGLCHVFPTHWMPLPEPPK